MFNVSGRMSTKTGVPPRRTTAFAAETKVNDGITTSSPGPMSSSSADISSAAVAECTRTAFAQPVWASSHSQHRVVNSPPAESCPRPIASAMWACSAPTTSGRLNGMCSGSLELVTDVSRYPGS
jgi:hypothetical protein